MAKVFLGGTTADSNWRDEFEKMLKIDFFNPVVDDWDEKAQEEELKERENCDFCLYTITPKMKGPYSIAEVVDDSNKRPDKAILVVLEDDGGEKYADHVRKSLDMVKRMVKENGGQVFESLKKAADYLNSKGGMEKKAESGDDNQIGLDDVAKMFDDEDREAIGDIFKALGANIIMGDISEDIIEAPLLALIKKSITRPKMQMLTKGLDEEDGRVDVGDATEMFKNDEDFPVGLMVIALGASIELGEFDVGKVRPYAKNILKKIIKRPPLQRALTNPVKLRNIVLKAIKQSDNRKLKTVVKNQVIRASMKPETPESSKNPVEQVREISASTLDVHMKEADIDFGGLYDSREDERGKGSKKPENQHKEVLKSLKKGSFFGKEDITANDADLLGKLYD